MKKISYALTMITLFGTFFPCFQAHAAGKKYIEFKNFENTTKNNEDLANKLANSKTFEAYYYYMYTLTMFATASLSTKSDKDLKQISSKLEAIADGTDVISDTYDIIGLKTDKVYTERISKLKSTLQTEFPELVLLDEIQRSAVVNNAIVIGNLQGKALAAADKDSCFNDAIGGHTACLANGRWWKAAAVVAGVICVIAVIACLAAGTIVTVGAGTAAFAAALLPFASACAGGIFLSFNLTSPASTACDNTFKTLTKSCADQYGKLTEGGAL